MPAVGDVKLETFSPPWGSCQASGFPGPAGLRPAERKRLKPAIIPQPVSVSPRLFSDHGSFCKGFAGCPGRQTASSPPDGAGYDPPPWPGPVVPLWRTAGTRAPAAAAVAAAYLATGAGCKANATGRFPPAASGACGPDNSPGGSDAGSPDTGRAASVYLAQKSPPKRKKSRPTGVCHDAGQSAQALRLRLCSIFTMLSRRHRLQ